MSSDGNQCVHGYAETSHGKTGDGYMKGSVATWKSYTTSTSSGPVTDDCSYEDNGAEWYRPSTNLAIRDFYYRLNNNPGDKSFPKNWSLCEYSDWFYNQKSTYKLTIAGEMHGPADCGNGYFGTLSSDWTNNGNWIGGPVWSGGHKLPASSSDALVSPNSTAGTSPSIYTGIDNVLAGTSDGELGTDGLLNPTLGMTTIAGPDGNPLINPATGQPFVVDLSALASPPTNIPGNATQVVTDLENNPIYVRVQGGGSELPELPGTVPGTTPAFTELAQSAIGEEFYLVPTHVAAEALLGAP